MSLYFSKKRSDSWKLESDSWSLAGAWHPLVRCKMSNALLQGMQRRIDLGALELSPRSLDSILTVKISLRLSMLSMLSLSHSLEWYIESFLRSLPAQSTNISWPPDSSRKMHTAWLLELTALASVAHVTRRDCAICITSLESKLEAAGSSWKQLEWSLRPWPRV